MPVSTIAIRSSDLRSRLLRQLRLHTPALCGQRILVAFSGGPDSTALLALLSELAAERPNLPDDQATPKLQLFAAHYDHRLDPDSRHRARRAQELSEELGVPFCLGHRANDETADAGESPEAAARRLRYRFLEAQRRALDARFLLTAHHRDDQAETLLLRMLHGTGIEGLAGIRHRRGTLLRPLLGQDRHDLRSYLAARGLEPILDPTNQDLRVPRNALRHSVLPHLARRSPNLVPRLARLADAAQGARRRLDPLLQQALEPHQAFRGVAVRRQRLQALPPELLAPALALLHRRAGSPYPARAAALQELRRQLAAGRQVGCDCGGGWRWEQQGEWLSLRHAPPPTPPFSYTLEVPAEAAVPSAAPSQVGPTHAEPEQAELQETVHERVLPELAVRIRLCRGSAAAEAESPAPTGPEAGDLSLGAPQTARARLVLVPGDRLTIRNRRPGDRVQPAGSSTRKRLKEVLIDRRVPRSQRDQLPLLCIGGNIAWVVGVTVDERFRKRDGGNPWIFEVEPA
ncbi:MAG: tRNA lysidine(34) synthetase TilS [Acidobacteriota bacterium]|nr:tRNA lysidine(34) synthetase TilS [Acidobacteriota bacterium]